MASNEPRVTAQTLKVLGSLMSSPQESLSGADIARTTKLATGTLYPILLRLEQAGWLESQWEAGDPRTLGRPRRRLYRVTALGKRKARPAFDDVASMMGRIAWA